MSNHDDSVFVRNFSLVLVGLFVIGLLAFVLAKLVNHSFQQSQDHAAVMAPRIAPVGQVNVGSEPIALAGKEGAAAASPAVEATASSGDPGKATYDKVCFVCHAEGIAGAPKYGDLAVWEARLGEGHDVLVEHAIKGFTGKAGVMPAKGGNPALSDGDVTAAVEYMLAAVGAGSATAPPAPAESAPPPAAPGTPAEAPVAPTAAVADSGKGKDIYDKACFVCHASGVAGAPKLGDQTAWASRVAKGMDVLYHSALNGLLTSTGMMPPKGGRPDFSDDDVKAAVDYMVSAAK